MTDEDTSKKEKSKKGTVPDRAKQRQSEAFARWYAKKKKAFNAERRQRYWNDEEMRQKAIEAARDYRARMAEQRPPPTREYNGKEVQVFTISEMADHVGLSAHTLRGWETKGLIPKPIFDEYSRLYTEHQIVLVDRMAKRIAMAEDRADRRQIEETWSQKLAEKWEDV